MSTSSHHPAPSLWRRLKRSTRSLRYALLIPVLELARLAAGALPHAAALAIGRALGRLAWRILPSPRRLAERQLLAAGVAGNPQEARRMARRVFESLGMGAIEWLHALSWNEARYRDRVRCVGFDDFEAACQEGQGIVLVSAHLGNWELMPSAIRIQTGRIIGSVMAEMSSPAITRWLVGRRAASKGLFFSNQASSLGIMRHLRRGGILALMADQDSTRGRGLFVDFFGRPAYTPIGPAHLARRVNAPIFVVTIAREASDPCRHVMRLAGPIRPDLALSEEEDLQRLTQAYTRELEARIRQAPEQWVWIHDRWRHRPGEKIRVRSAGRLKINTAPPTQNS